MDVNLAQALEVNKIYNQMARLLLINANTFYHASVAHYNPNPLQIAILTSMQMVEPGRLVYNRRTFLRDLAQDNCLESLGRLISKSADGDSCYVEKIDGEVARWYYPDLLAIIEEPQGYINLFDSASWVKSARERHKL